MEALLDPSICYIRKPQKKPLFTDASLTHIPEDIRSECLFHILELVKKTLFTWADWSVNLPPSQLTLTLDKKNATPNVGDLFVHQDFEEYLALAKDDQHRSRLLNTSQLVQLRDYGRFDVESRDFPGHQHSWYISSGLQKGRARVLATLQRDLLKGLEYLVVGAKNRLTGDFFSTRVAIFAFADFFRMFIDLLIGLPHVHHDDIDRKLLEERLDFATGDLTVKTTQRQTLEAFWNFAERVSYLPDTINLGEVGQPPSPPFIFITPSKLPIDLRIYDNQVLERCLGVINRLRQEVHDNWFDEFKTSLYTVLKRAGKSNDEIKDIICARGLNEYAKRLFEAMRSSHDLREIDPTIAEALIEEATFSLAVMESKASLCDSWLAYKHTVEGSMECAHPVLWRIPRWRKQRMAQVKAAFMKEHRLDVHKSVMEKCKELGLHQYGYLVKRDFLFLTERESRIREELIKTSVLPDNRFRYKVTCKLMRHWRVYRRDTVFPYHRERVDGVLLRGQQPGGGASEAPASPAHECIALLPQASGLNQFNKPEYSVRKHWVFKSSTRYAFWRWHVFLVATLVLLIRSSQLFLYSIPLKSSVSFTALFRKDPIRSSADIDSKTGYLYYTEEGQSATLRSRLTRLWDWARTSAGAGRGAGSAPRRFCVHLAAVVLSILLALLMPPVCTVLSTLSVAFGLIAIALIPPLSIGFHILCVVLWDFYKPDIFCLVEAFGLRENVVRRGVEDEVYKGNTSITEMTPTFSGKGLFRAASCPVTWCSSSYCRDSARLDIAATAFRSLRESLLASASASASSCSAPPATQPNALLPILEVFVWHLAIRSLLQFVTALLCAILVYPFLCLTFTLFGILRWCLRSTWDAMTYHLCLKFCIRIPAHNNCILQRRAGPGLSPMHFYKARLADVCAILESQLETMELDEWKAQMEEIAREPLKAYNSLAESLAWLSLSPVEKGIFSQLRAQTKAWLEEVNLKTKQRRKALQPNFPRCQATRLKLSANELQKFTIVGAGQTQRFYETRILPRLQLLNRNPEEWWSNRGLRTDDFSGLCMKLMKNVLGEQFLISLKETDAVFPLHVRRKGIVSRFARVVPPTPFITRRPPTANEFCTKEVGEQNLFLRCRTPSRAISLTTRHSLPSSFVSKAPETTYESPKCGSYPTICGEGNRHRLVSTPVEQPSIDVDTDNSEWKCSSQDSKRQTVILVNGEGDGTSEALHKTETQLQAKAASEDSTSDESVVFIHVELPLFPLSAFVPRSLQEAAAARNNRIVTQADPRTSPTDHKTTTKSRRPSERSVPVPAGDSPPSVEVIRALLKEEPLPAIGTLPIIATVQPPPTEVKRPQFGRRCRDVLRKCILRTLTRNWRSDKFPQVRRELSFSDVIENIGRLMHPVEIVLTMHSRLLEERKIDRAHPILVKYISELTAFPPMKTPPPLKPEPSPVSYLRQQIYTLQFATASSTPVRNFSLRQEPKVSHTLESPLERALDLESPRHQRREWDEFNLVSWWDLESRRGRDFLELREPVVDFYTAVTDTTTSAYEETEDLDEEEEEEEEEELEGEDAAMDPLLENAALVTKLVIENGERRLVRPLQRQECSEVDSANEARLKNNKVSTASANETPEAKLPILVVSNSDSPGGWATQRPHSICSTIAESAPDDGSGLDRAHQNGSLGSVGRSIASQSTVRLAAELHHSQHG